MRMLLVFESMCLFVWGGVKIEDDCWIGAGAIILNGITIGKGSVVGAGAVVTKDIEPYTIVGGNPARKIRDLQIEHTDEYTH